MGHRNYRLLDRALIALEAGLGGWQARNQPPASPSPAAGQPETLRDAADRQTAARLMRVNHTGEICAQALYLGQGAFARTEDTAQLLAQAAHEELDHLHWCRERLAQLDSRPSRLDPFWFAGAYAIGALSAAAGDAQSLGFLAETERQVVQHLEEHLERLPANDRRSRAILRQMRRDEARHEATANRHGAGRLPTAVRLAMRVQAAMMKAIAARV